MKRIQLFSMIFLFALSIQMKAQCETCTIHVTGIDTASYIVIAGQKLCVDSTGLLTGHVTLNGGAICNNGIFKPSTFAYTSGSLTNQGNMSINVDITVSSGSSIENSFTGIMSLPALTINGSSVTNGGILNVDQNIQFNSGTFTNDNIVNANLINGSGTITNTGTINTNN